MTLSQRIAGIGALLAAFAASRGAAQTIPGAVLARNEPHHHATYTDSTFRVLRVHVPAHDTTLLHEHIPDYFWIALGPSDVVNVRPGQPDAVIKSADLSVHYTPGRFAHVARNPGAASFDNITIEVLQPQSNVHNLCALALGGQPLDCATPAKAVEGVTTDPAFNTDQLRVSVVTIEPGMILRPSGRGTAWVIALDTTLTRSALKIEGSGRWVGGVVRADARKLAVKNAGRNAIHVLAVEQRHGD